MVKKCATVAGHVNIGITIIIKISDRDALTVVSLARESSLFSSVCKRAIAVVAIQDGTKRLGGLVNVGRSGLYEKEIHQAVLVVVDQTHAGSHGFEIILFLGLG